MRQDQAGAATGARNARGNAGRPTHRRSRCKVSARVLQREFLVAWFVLRNRNTPWYVRIIAGAVVTYVLSPIQIIPSFIPFIGLMDDVLVLSAGMGLIRLLVPSALLREACRRAQAAMERGENLRPLAVRTVTVIVAVCWLAMTVGLFLRLHRH